MILVSDMNIKQRWISFSLLGIWDILRGGNRVKMSLIYKVLIAYYLNKFLISYSLFVVFIDMF